MRRIKEQRNLAGKDRDRFLVMTTVDTGERIRSIADHLQVTYSKLIGDLIETHLGEIENELEEATTQ